jgi:hypothetical protein
MTIHKVLAGPLMALMLVCGLSVATDTSIDSQAEAGRYHLRSRTTRFFNRATRSQPPANPPQRNTPTKTSGVQKKQAVPVEVSLLLLNLFR